MRSLITNHRCAITGRGVRYGSSTLVEACHIEPFAKRQLCTLYNGMSLAPDIHKLFDAHYLTIDSDYRVFVSTKLQELADTPYYTSLHGQKLRLPERAELWPRQELLEGHRGRFVG